jgi:hypothetical protein
MCSTNTCYFNLENDDKITSGDFINKSKTNQCLLLNTNFEKQHY